MTRIKYDGNFPKSAIKECLRVGNIDSSDVDIVYAVSTNHFISVEQHYSGVADKLFKHYFPEAQVKYIGHHFCHAASSVFTSPFNEGSFLTFDGGGSSILDETRRCIDYIENPSMSIKSSAASEIEKNWP